MDEAAHALEHRDVGPWPESSFRKAVALRRRKALDRPNDPSRPVLVAVATLLGDDLVLDLVVGRLRHHLLLYEFVLTFVGSVLDDLLGVGLADTRDRLQLIGRGAVDVERLLLRRRWRLLLRLGGGPCPCRCGPGAESEHEGNKKCDQSSHDAPPRYVVGANLTLPPGARSVKEMTF